MNLAHLHLFLDHLPVLGTGFGPALLIFGLGRPSVELKKTALGVLALVASAAVPVYLAGEPAEEPVEAVPGVSKPAMERHGRAASVSFTVVPARGAVAQEVIDVLAVLNALRAAFPPKVSSDL